MRHLNQISNVDLCIYMELLCRTDKSVQSPQWAMRLKVGGSGREAFVSILRDAQGCVHPSQLPSPLYVNGAPSFTPWMRSGQRSRILTQDGVTQKRGHPSHVVLAKETHNFSGIASYRYTDVLSSLNCGRITVDLLELCIYIYLFQVKNSSNAFM